jgi:non-ribosomal peptide synthetase component F
MKLTVPPGVRTRMNDYSKTHKISTYKLFLSALSIYISKVTGLEEFVVGAAGHNRSAEHHKKMTGMFVSSLPFKIKVHRNWGFHRFTDHTARETNTIIKNHQKYPFDLLAVDLREKTGVDVAYLLKINLVHHPDIPLKEKKYKIERHFPGYETAGLSLHINGENKNIHGTLELIWDYQERLFSPGISVKFIKVWSTFCVMH